MRQIALVVAVVLVAISGCVDSPLSSTAPGDLTTTELAQEMERLSKAAEELIGEAWCHGPDDCRTMAWGSKPCGGPATHIVYSATMTDAAQLQAVADSFHDLQDEHNRRAGIGSDCMYVSPPEVDCVDSRCGRQ